jgi:hypothetical protein
MSLQFKHPAPLANPYEFGGSWWFYDESEDVHGPFLDRATATRRLITYCTEFLALPPPPPTRWERFKAAWRRFVQS